MTKTMIAVFLASALALPAAAKDDAGSASKQQMIEKHEKMARMHSKMADCLKSGKDAKECHEGMHKECPMGKGEACGEGCPMCAMHGGHGKHGKGRDGMHKHHDKAGKAGAEAPEKK